MANNAILGAMLLSIKIKADTSGLNKTDKALRKTSNSIKAMSKDLGFISKLSKGFLGFLGLRGISDSFKNYLQFEKDYGAMKSRFYAITKDEGLAAEEFNYIKNVAIATANSIKSVADSYSIFYAAARRPLGQTGAREIFETWTKVSRVLHLNETQFEGVTYALREMSSKGQLYSQDLKIQLGTHVPDAINIAETAIKKLGLKGVETVEDFQKLTKKEPQKGWMSKFLLEFSREAGRRFASPEALKKALAQPDALEQSIKLLKDVFLYEFSEAGGNKAITNILMGVRDALMRIDYEAWANALGKIAEGVSKIAFHIPLIFGILKDIALSVAILSFFRIFAKVLTAIQQIRLVLFGLKKGWDLTRIRNLNFIAKTIATIGKTIGKQGIKGWLVGTVAGLLGISGPLGWIAGSLMFLPEIVNLIKWFAKLKGWNDKKNPFMPFDVSNQAVLDMFKKLSVEKIDSQEKLRERVKTLTGSSMLAEQSYYDNGNVYIELNGVRYNDDVVEGLINGSIKAVKDSKKDMFANLYQKPNNKIDEYSQKVLRERYEWSTNL